MTLSKSQYIRALQCKKSIWLYKNRPELRSVHEENESLFNIGYTVGDMAKKLFSGRVEVEFDSKNFDGMTQETKELLKTESVIYEATFKQKDIFAIVDILVKNGDKWDIYEVKSSTSVKDYHIDDASIQYYALSDVLDIGKTYILCIDSSYERDGELELDKLFYANDISEEILEKQKHIPKFLTEIRKVLENNEPNIKVSEHCSYPFECDFCDYCWGDTSDVEIFNLYRMNWSKKYELYFSGIKKFDDLPKNFKLNQTQQIQIQTSKTNKPHVDKKVIKEFLDTIKYPINFFDFETFMEPIPRFNRQRPYMQMPFQYSLHVLHEHKKLEHFEFLGDENKDPRVELIKSMLKNFTKNGSIVAYNQSFEISRIKELACLFPKYENELLSLVDRFVDLIVPFRSLGFYHKNFNGSFSIKSVLPAMFPNDFELDYHNLGSVQNGGDAMDIFASLHLLKDKNQREAIRKDLLAYCRLDTLAMVRIYEKLKLLCS